MPVRMDNPGFEALMKLADDVDANRTLAVEDASLNEALGVDPHRMERHCCGKAALNVVKGALPYNDRIDGFNIFEVLPDRGRCSESARRT